MGIIPSFFRREALPPVPKESAVQPGNIILQRHELGEILDTVAIGDRILVPDVSRRHDAVQRAFAREERSLSMESPRDGELFLVQDWVEYTRKESDKSGKDLRSAYLNHLIEKADTDDWKQLMDSLCRRIESMANNKGIQEGTISYDPLVVWNYVILTQLVKASQGINIPEVYDDKYKKAAIKYHELATEANGFLDKFQRFMVYNRGQGDGPAIDENYRFPIIPNSQTIPVHIMPEPVQPIEEPASQSKELQEWLKKVEKGGGEQEQQGQQKPQSLPAEQPQPAIPTPVVTPSPERVPPELQSIVRLGKEIAQISYANSTLVDFEAIFTRQLLAHKGNTINFNNFVDCLINTNRELQSLTIYNPAGKRLLAEDTFIQRPFELMQMSNGNIVILGYNENAFGNIYEVEYFAVMEGMQGSLFSYCNPRNYFHSRAKHNDFQQNPIDQRGNQFIDESALSYLGLPPGTRLLAKELRRYAVSGVRPFGKVLI